MIEGAGIISIVIYSIVGFVIGWVVKGFIEKKKLEDNGLYYEGGSYKHYEDE